MAASSKNETCFSCTACGQCCRDTLLQLTFTEAMQWVAEGGSIGVEAKIFPSLNVDGDSVIDFIKQRTFPARCGKQEVRIDLDFVSIVQGACRNLIDNRCSAYDRRPLVCQAYPAEINELMGSAPINPQEKVCPGEAWAGEILMVNNVIKNSTVHSAVMKFQSQKNSEVALRRYVADILGVHVGRYIDLETECWLVHPIASDNVAAVLQEALHRHASRQPYVTNWWQVYAHSDAEANKFKKQGLYAVCENRMKDATLIVKSSQSNSAGEYASGNA